MSSGTSANVFDWQVCEWVCTRPATQTHGQSQTSPLYETDLVKFKPTINKVHYNSAENCKTLIEGEQIKQLTDGNRLEK